MPLDLKNSGNVPAHLPGRRFDHLFFSAMIVLMLGTVLLGFAHSYYLAGTLHAPLPARVLHVHAVVFTAWMLLLLTQTLLASFHGIRIHRQLGMAGIILAILVGVLGVLAAANSLARHAAGQDSALVPLTDLLIFIVLTGCAFHARSQPAAHKRLILIGSAGLLTPAIFRWPFPAFHHNFNLAVYTADAFVAMLVLYDLWSMRKVHRTTLLAGAFMILVQQLRLPIGDTAAWHAVDLWIRSQASCRSGSSTNSKSGNRSGTGPKGPSIRSQGGTAEAVP
jgi:hypothetical protein